MDWNKEVFSAVASLFMRSVSLGFFFGFNKNKGPNILQESWALKKNNKNKNKVDSIKIRYLNHSTNEGNS